MMTYPELRRKCFDKKLQILQNANYLEYMYNNIMSQNPDDIRRKRFIHVCFRMEYKYRMFLRKNWGLCRGDDPREFSEIMDKSYARMCIDSYYREPLADALSDAKEVTWLERLTDSNKRDEETLRSLLRTYADSLLTNMMNDFLEDVPR